MNPLEIRNIYKSFSQGDHYLMVLKGASYTLETGMVTALVGPSGSGKSTLLEIMGLMDKPDSGDVLIRGVNISKAKDERLTKIRGRYIGFVYQFHHLLPEFTAMENVMLQDLINGIKDVEAIERAEYILKLLKLENRMHHLPSELSGGEQQRVAIARALVKSPTLLLADEPTGNLDPYNAELVLDLFLSTVKELKVAALVVTHNEQLARRTDAIVTLKDGKITSL